MQYIPMLSDAVIDNSLRPLRKSIDFHSAVDDIDCLRGSEQGRVKGIELDEEILELG